MSPAVARSRIACPKCGADVRPADAQVTRQKKALVLYAIAGVATLLWIGFLLAWQPVWLVPKNLAAGVLIGAAYLAPGLIIGGVASMLPSVRRIRCSKCRVVSMTVLGS